MSPVGIVLWGTLVDSLLPVAMRPLGFDLASATTPFAASFVDVTGPALSFNVTSVILRDTL
jgi:magnesium transporter